MKSIHGIAVVFLALVITIFWSIFSYNGLVSIDEKVKADWSEVQNQLKRRCDLIPNLVNTVKGYADHERTVFAEVTEARAKVGQAASIDVSKLAKDPGLQKQLLESQQSLNASIGRLIAVAENYPQLKADGSFLRLQDELAGTENRIAVARGRAIKDMQEFNSRIRSFPTVMVARLGGFDAKQYYEAQASEQATPVVDFSRR